MAACVRRLREFRVRKDVLADYNNEELIKRYRMDLEGILYLTNLVRHHLTSPTKRNLSLDAETKIAITLRFLATGKMQLCSGDDFGVSQPTVSRVISDTLNVLCDQQIVRQFIAFPTSQQETQRHNRQFHALAGFPGVVGVIDGTHVCILSPSQDEAEYVNRKNYHSLNVQLVFDSDSNIRDVVAKWPGATHDARIFNESGVRQLFERGLVPAGSHLLGDSGYPCKRYLLTPYLHPNAGPETNYNRSHKITKSVVERGIGQLKRRFHVLHGEIRLAPTKASKVVIACAVLHNICKARNIPLPLGQDGHQDGQRPPPLLVQQPADGVRYRQQFVNLHF